MNEIKKNWIIPYAPLAYLHENNFCSQNTVKVILSHCVLSYLYYKKIARTKLCFGIFSTLQTAPTTDYSTISVELNVARANCDSAKTRLCAKIFSSLACPTHKEKICPNQKEKW